ncbi:uncharacterized protein LAJ45_03716 [Morchella importuna]|uniref:uncharacterized protein n=1 Tax=Morchella importuna TaxID=1174673 RepID=UPI001E8CF0EB|nr:uncharacterized protein LAJ45_03716 [Morchella importuna]KAH8152289.1 hypothetical protein LAJ45_03716 [Morchella importuna]
MPFIAIRNAYRSLRARRMSLDTFFCFVVNIFKHQMFHLTIFFLHMWRFYVVIGQQTHPTTAMVCTNTTSVVVNLPKYQEVYYPVGNNQQAYRILRWREDVDYVNGHPETRMVEVKGSVYEYSFEPIVRGASGIHGVDRAPNGDVAAWVAAVPRLHGGWVI